MIGPDPEQPAGCLAATISALTALLCIALLAAMVLMP